MVRRAAVIDGVVRECECGVAECVRSLSTLSRAQPFTPVSYVGEGEISQTGHETIVCSCVL